MRLSDNVIMEDLATREPFISAQPTCPIHAAIRYIENNLDKSLTLAEIASHVFLSRAYLSTRFKQITGENIAKFIYEKRMQKAKHLLLSTQDQVQSIAFRCGYSSPAYFSASFRRYYQKSPRELRREAEKE